MPIFSLVYGSNARLAAGNREPAIAEIVSESAAYNADRDITGVLLYADGQFAQLLEGEEDDVRDLMARIEADPRHCDVRVTLQEQRSARRVTQWSMAYAGPSQYVAAHIKPLVTSADRQVLDRASRRLIALMVEFSSRDVSRFSHY